MRCVASEASGPAVPRMTKVSCSLGSLPSTPGDRFTVHRRWVCGSFSRATRNRGVTPPWCLPDGMRIVFAPTAAYGSTAIETRTPGHKSIWGSKESASCSFTRVVRHVTRIRCGVRSCRTRCGVWSGPWRKHSFGRLHPGYQARGCDTLRICVRGLAFRFVVTHHLILLALPIIVATVRAEKWNHAMSRNLTKWAMSVLVTMGSIGVHADITEYEVTWTRNTQTLFA